MAKRRVNKDGSWGYSEQSLAELERGEYGRSTGRKAKYNTSAEQTQQIQELPILKGMGASFSSNNWERKFGKNQYSNGIDPMRARQRYAERNAEQQEVATNDENYVVNRERYNKLMQNSRLANDIKKLAEVNYNNLDQDATIMPEFAENYGARAITGGLTKSQFLTQLSKRYELTPKELEDMAFTFHSDAYKSENEAYGKQLEQFGKEHPVLGSAGSLVGTIGGGVEGIYNTAVGMLGGDDRFLSNIYSTTKNSPREGVKSNMSTDVGKGLYDIGMGISDMFAGAATGSAPFTLAGNTANEAQQSAMQRGSSVRRASAYATGAGVLDFITNKVGLEKAKSLALSGVKSAGIKGFLAKNGLAGLAEAGENVLQNIGQYYLDDLINGENSELRQSFADKIANGADETEAFKETAKEYALQLAKSAAIGFGMGSAMQAGASILPRLRGNTPTPEATSAPVETPEAPLLPVVNNSTIEVPDYNKLKADWESGRAELPRVQAESAPVEAPIKAPETKRPLSSKDLAQILAEVDKEIEARKGGTSAPVEVNPEDVIYHAGILSRLNKADSAGKMEGSRDTGYFGTGHYFVDQANRGLIGEGTSYGKKPYTSVDISKYDNLMRVDTDAKANKLHDFSQRMMRFVNGFNDKYYSEDGQIVPERMKEYMDEMYSSYKELFGDKAMSRSDFEARLNDFRKNYDYDFYDRGDSAFTTFMKEHGYNGVDSRGTKSAGTDRGVVVYDLDEDSILQSNVTDENAKSGLMNTKVRDGSPLFDEELDNEIRSKIKSQEKQKAIRTEYRSIYDESKLKDLQDQINAAKEELDNLEGNAIEYYQRILDDDNFVRSEAEKLNKEFEQFGLPTEDVETIIADKRKSAAEGIEEARANAEEARNKLAMLQQAYDAEEKLSDAAYKQAKANIEGASMSAKAPAETPAKAPISEPTAKTAPVTFESEQAKIDKLLDGKKADSITTESGHIFEHYSQKEMKDTLKAIKEHGYCDDEQVAIVYNDGSSVVYGDGDDTSNMKLTGIKKVIWNNANTSAYSGNGVNIVNYDDSATNPVDADWRLVFEEDYPRSEYKASSPQNTEVAPENPQGTSQLEIEDADFARAVANANPDNSFSRMNALLEQVGKKNGEIDNSGEVGYNDVVKGVDNGTEVSTGNDRAGSEGILRGIREGEPVSEEVRGNEPSGRGQLQTDSVFSPDELTSSPRAYDESDLEILKSANVETENFVSSDNNATRFADALTRAKENNENGAAVDAHDANEIQEIINNGGKTFLLEDGTMGFAVEGDGNLTAVFKNPVNETKGMGSKAALAAIKNGAVKGDCFGRKLVNIYAMAGFQPVARMEYGYGFDDAMDAQVRDQLAKGIINKEPDVYVLKLRDGYDFDTAARNFNDAKVYSQEELDKLPLYTDYDEMLAYRDSLISQPAKAEPTVPKVVQTEGEAVRPVPKVEGEAARPPKDVTTPPSDDERIRSFSKRGSMDETLPEEIRRTLTEDRYNVIHNEDVARTVDELFDPDDLTQTRSNLEQALQKKDPSAALLSYKLAKAYVDDGQYDAATDVIEKVSAELTRAGQFTQAAKLAMMQNNPMAAMRAYMRDLQSLNQWGKEKYGKKWTELKLSKEDVDLFNKVKNGDADALNQVVNRLNAKFGKQIPASLWDKVVAGTKISMLLNLRTQGRNIFSNMAVLPVRSLSDRVSAVGQNVAHIINPDFEVTQSLVGGTAAQKKIAKQVFENMKDDIVGGNKMKDSVKSGVLENRQIFNDDLLGQWIDNATNGGLQKLNEKLGGTANKSTGETLSNFTYWLMGDFGDVPFVRRNFINRLASYMKAQNINNAEDIPDDAISLSIQEALKATFKDDNAFTKALEGTKKKWGKFGEVALPFVKTPANLAMRAIDYSPVGLVNTFRKLKSGAEANRVIDELAKNLTGTAMIYLGYKLREKGLLSGNYSEDRDEKAFQKQQGMLENALHIKGKYFTFDWAQPTSTPLILGSVLYDAVKNSDDENRDILNGLNSAYKGGLAVANSWLSTSPLQSLSEMLGGDQTRGDKGGVAGNIMNQVIEFPQRLIPAQLGAIARTSDRTIRDTYTNDNTLTGLIGNQVRGAKAKIPGLSKTLPASYDAWGNERTRSDTTWGAAISQNVNPGQFGNDNSTPLDADILKLYQETGNNKVFPKSVSYSVNLGGESKKLTNEEHSEYQKTIGQQSYKLAEELMNSEAFKSLSSEEKVKALDDAYGLADTLAKESVFGYTSDQTDKLKDAFTEGKEKGAVSYIIDKTKANALDLDVETYRKKQAEFPGGAEKYAEAKKAAKDLGINTDVYIEKEAKYDGGAKAYVDDKQKAIDYGFVDKDGDPVMKNYEIAKNVFGDDDAAIKEYSNYKQMGLTTNDEKVPYLMNNTLFSNEQKGMILSGHSDGTLGDNAAKGAAEMFNMGGYEGYYYYYLIQSLANTDGKKGVTKKEREAFFAGDSQELDDLWRLNQDMYMYLMNNLK